MLRHIGVASAAVALLLPFTVIAQLGGRVLSILAFIVEQVHQVVSSEEIHCHQTEQQRENPAQFLCTRRFHEADGLSE